MTWKRKVNRKWRSAITSTYPSGSQSELQIRCYRVPATSAKTWICRCVVHIELLCLQCRTKRRSVCQFETDTTLSAHLKMKADPKLRNNIISFQNVYKLIKNAARHGQRISQFCKCAFHGQCFKYFGKLHL